MPVTIVCINSKMEYKILLLIINGLLVLGATVIDLSTQKDHQKDSFSSFLWSHRASNLG